MAEHSRGPSDRAAGVCVAAAAAALATALLPTAAAAQRTWSLRAMTTASDRAGAFDPVRRAVMVYGGYERNRGSTADTWFHDAAGWRGARPAVDPGPQRGHAMATDTRRDSILLFGADGATWSWNGAGWRPQVTPVAPSARQRAAMAYDPARDRVVLFGGTPTVAPLDDTWEWDGAAWLRATPAARPPARNDGGMAHDPAGGGVVLLTAGNLAFPGETWRWDGANWAQLAPTAQPGDRSRHLMVTDTARQRIVLFGGGTPVLAADTWEWDGTDWVEQTPATSPPGQWAYTGVMVYDAASARTLLLTGSATTWAWNGVDWQQIEPLQAPEPRYAAAMAYDAVRERTLLFGGAGPAGQRLPPGTWRWDGRDWTRLAPTTEPPGRSHAGLTHDPVRDATVLFGGIAGTTTLDDTWSWTGADWRPEPVGARPAARFGHTLGFDRSLQRVVLFGGASAVISGARSSWLDDTWTWDGASWQQLAVAVRPPARAWHGMAAEAGAGGLLVFGGAGDPFYPGTSAPTSRNDTWRLLGATWSRLQPATSPPPRWSMGMAADEARGRILMFAGYNGSPPTTGPNAGIMDDTWEWDGIAWTGLTPVDVPRFRYGPALVFDRARDQYVAFGGMGSWYGDETLAFGAVFDHVTYAAGCAGSLGVPGCVPGADSRPALGGRLVTDVTNVAGPFAVMAVEVGGPQATPHAAPIPLAALGMPGCDRWIDPMTSVLLLPTANVATWSLAVPWDTALLGAQLFQQAVVADPGTNAAGFVVTNAARCRIGI